MRRRDATFVEGDDVYDVVETSCSSSSRSDGDTWGFGAHDDDEQPHANAADGSTLRHAADSRTPLLNGHIGRAVPQTHRIVRCVPRVHGSVPPLLGCSSVELFPQSINRPTVVMLHGGVERVRGHTALNAVPPRNDSVILTKTSEGWTAAGLPTGQLVLLDTQGCIHRHPAPATTAPAPLSLKRWLPSARPPHRFGHCSVRLHDGAVPIHTDTMRQQWMEHIQRADSGASFESIDVAMTFTLGGTGNGHLPATSLLRNRIDGCVLAEPMLQLCVRLHSGTTGESLLWSSWARLLPDDEDGQALPRAFFAMCPWWDGREGAATNSVSCTATFLLLGGTEDGVVPLYEGAFPSTLTVDPMERTYRTERLATLGNSPPARFGHTMTWVAASKQYVLHGGVGQQSIILSDVFVLDASTRVWREVVVPVGDAAIARPRAFHVSWCESSQNARRLNEEDTVVFFGGEGPCADGPVGPASAFDLSRNLWSLVVCPLLDSDPLVQPPPRAVSNMRASMCAHEESPRARSDVALRDVLQLTHARSFDAHSARPHNLGVDVGAVCHGSAATVTQVASGTNGRSAWVFGGTCNLHGVSTTAVCLEPCEGTLKEAAAMWILQSEGAEHHSVRLDDESRRCGASSSEYHARRLSATAQMKIWGV